MRAQDSPGDAAIADLAQRQHGRVAHRQLRLLGFATSSIDRRVQRGILIRLYRGVYAGGHVSKGASGRWMAAVLACGDDAVLSHRSAARCHRRPPYLV
jgi:hypothetical protein